MKQVTAETPRKFVPHINTLSEMFCHSYTFIAKNCEFYPNLSFILRCHYLNFACSFFASSQLSIVHRLIPRISIHEQWLVGSSPALPLWSTGLNQSFWEFHFQYPNKPIPRRNRHYKRKWYYNHQGIVQLYGRIEKFYEQGMSIPNYKWQC